MKIFCISGKAGSGKDTAAGLMQNYLRGDGQRVLILHYADLLKFMCKQLFGWDGKKDERGRHLLQYVGTDVVRKKNPDLWVGFVEWELKLFPDYWDYVIIPDCRFPNEITILIQGGFDVTHIRVQREGCKGGLTQEQREHASETALDGTIADYTLENNGTIADLAREVLVMMNNIAIKRVRCNGGY